MGQARRDRQAKRAADDESLVCAMQFGAVAHHDDLDGLAATKKHTHDGVIALTGIARRSGVTWLIYDRAEALAKLDELAASPDGSIPALSVGDDEVRAELRQYLTDNEHSLLVIACVYADARVAAAGMS